MSELRELLLDLYLAGVSSTRCCGRAEEKEAIKESDELIDKILAQFAELQHQLGIVKAILVKVEDERNALLQIVEGDYGHGVDNGYWPDIAPILRKIREPNRNPEK